MIWGAYVHIPWCRIRCPYCAFVVEELRSPLAREPSAYTDAVLHQWEGLARDFSSPPSSIAFGGGTPSLHPPAELGRIVQALAPAPGAEITLEANPEDIDPVSLAALRDVGVTRLSLGVQSFQRHTARVLSRVHTIASARSALEAASAAGLASWSVDLIFAMPGQTPTDLLRDLDIALAANVPHVSLYGLSEEEGTPYARGVALGRIQPPGPDAWRELYDLARDRLRAAGLEQYEVSNFARPAHRSHHNEHYWRCRPYAGLGVGAHGRLPDGTCTVSQTDLHRYLETPETWAHRELPDDRALAEELLLCCLRHADGLDLGRLEAVGWRLGSRSLDRVLDRGWVSQADGRLGLTFEGFPVADAITAELAADLEAPSELDGRKHPA